MGELTFFLGLQVKQKSDGIFISQDKYVAEILKKFDFSSVKTASTPMEPNKALVKDLEAEDVDVHLHRSMIGSLMYLKGQPKLGLWYPKDSPFDLEAYSDSDYARTSLDRKYTTREYVAAANYCWQLLWIQNQMLDYGFNFMKTKIYIDNESTICIVKNLVFHSKTKHIEIRHHFIRDSYEKRLIKVLKIHIDHKVADLLIKGFDVSRFNFLIASIVWFKGRLSVICSGLCLKWKRTTVIDELKVNAVSQELVLSAQVKKVNGVVEIQALVDGKQIVVSKDAIRRLLKFNDEGRMDCLPNATIFEEIARMRYKKLTQKLTFYKAFFSPQWKFLIHTFLHCLSAKTTAWNEFSSIATSAIICLSTNQQFNFSKFILEDRRVKKLEKDKKKRTHKLKRLYKVGLSTKVISSDDEEPILEVQEDEFKPGRRIADIDEDAKVLLVDEVQGRSDERNEMMFDADKDLSSEEVVVEKVVEKVAEVSLNDDEITLAQTLQKLKNTPKAKGVSPKARSIFMTFPRFFVKTVFKGRVLRGLTF
ncbi:hypothetical protein Tco_1021063 [Tanacetum coccineum]